MNKMKKLALSLCFVLLLCFVLNAVSYVLADKRGAEVYSEFWEDPSEYDVWFLGTSHVYNSIYPMELWDQHGIRSYNLGASASNMPQTYWTMMCALEYSKPKVIVLDVYKVHLDLKYQTEGLVHYGMDCIPLSATKFQGICDLFDNWGKRLEYVCGFLVYHNRWEELAESDFNFRQRPLKGAQFEVGVKDNSKYRMADEDTRTDETDIIGFNYLEKIIKECKEQGIELVLTALPFCSKENVQGAMNTVTELAQEYDVPYLNMGYMDLLDFSIDFSDRNHTNLFGCRKVTRYIGDYLAENYDLTDYRNVAEVSEAWNEDFAQYLNLRMDEMRQTADLKIYVQWLADERYTCQLYRKKEPQGMLAKEFAQLDNISLISEEEAKERIGGEIKGDYVFFVENEQGEAVDTAVFQKGQRK